MTLMTVVRLILLETATDLGDPGVDEVYGWGLVNISAGITHLQGIAGQMAAIKKCNIPRLGGAAAAANGGKFAAAAGEGAFRFWGGLENRESGRVWRRRNTAAYRHLARLGIRLWKSIHFWRMAKCKTPNRKVGRRAFNAETFGGTTTICKYRRVKNRGSTTASWYCSIRLANRFGFRLSRSRQRFGRRHIRRNPTTESGRRRWNGMR